MQTPPQSAEPSTLPTAAPKPLALLPGSPWMYVAGTAGLFIVPAIVAKLLGGDIPAWVQAVGSVGAILATGWGVLYTQQVQNAHAEAERKHAEQQLLEERRQVEAERARAEQHAQEQRRLTEVDTLQLIGTVIFFSLLNMHQLELQNVKGAKLAGSMIPLKGQEELLQKIPPDRIPNTTAWMIISTLLTRLRAVQYAFLHHWPDASFDTDVVGRENTLREAIQIVRAIELQLRPLLIALNADLVVHSAPVANGGDVVRTLSHPDYRP